MTETPLATSDTSADAPRSDARSVTILGGGLAGLSAAQKFSESGWDVTVLEREAEVGGLASSFVQDGYTCDHGPHRLYSSLKELNDHFKMVLDGNHHDRNRLSRIYMKGKFFDYPLKAGNVLRSLPPWLLFRSFFDYFVVRVRNAVRPIPDDNFENWVIKRFGRTLYDLFFGTYTRKAWGIPCNQISADWASQRISLLSLWDTVKKTVFKPRNTPRTLVSVFLYPVKGGIGELSRGYQRLVERDGGKVITGASVVQVESDGDTVTGITYEKDGARHTATSDLYVSTIPLTLLVPMLGSGVPARCHEAVAGLKHKGIVFVYLKLDRPQLTPDHWIYIPEEHIAVHRISEFTNFSKDCAPEGKSLVCAEITATKGDKHWTMDDEDLVKLATDNLVTLGLLKPDEVMSGGFVRRLDYAYPIYDLTYRAHVDSLMGYLKTFGNMVSTGRQGLFRYGNMDHSIAMGHAVARRTLEKRGIDHSEVAAGDEYFG